MMTDLFDHYPKASLERFKKYHAENPQVYEKFRELAIEMRANGRRKYSAEIIINVMRWHFDLKTKGDVFEINNDFKSIYARLLVYHHPEFASFFEFRKVRAKGIKSDEQREREIYQ